MGLDLFTAAISRVFVTLSGALATIIVARTLGANEYGIFAFLYSTIFLLLFPIKLGLDSAAIKFIARYNELNEKNKLNSFIVWSRAIVWKTSLLAAAIIFIILLVFSSSTYKSPALIALFTLILLSQVHIDQGILYGLKKTALAPLSEGVIRSALLSILILIFYYFLPFKNTATTAFIANGLSVLAAFCFGRLVLNKISKPLDGVSDLTEKVEWIRAGRMLLIVSSAHLILSQTDLFMLGLLSNSTEAGYYGAASQIATFLLFFSQVVGPVIAPQIAATFSSKNQEKLTKLIIQGTTIVLILTAPVFLGLLIFKDQVIEILFGSSFKEAGLALAILLTAQFIKAIFAPMGYVLTMTNREKLASYVISAAAIINILLNLWLVPIYGAKGAAISTLISAVFWNLAVFLIVFWSVRTKSQYLTD